MGCRRTAKDKGGKGKTGSGSSVTKVGLVPLNFEFSPDVDAGLVISVFTGKSAPPNFHIMSGLSHPIMRNYSVHLLCQVRAWKFIFARVFQLFTENSRISNNFQTNPLEKREGGRKAQRPIVFSNNI